MKYKQLLERIIGLLYLLKQEGEQGYFDIKKLIEVFEYPLSPEDLRELVEYLEAQGYIRAIFSLGTASVEITPRGMLYIEEEKNAILPELEGGLKELKEHARSEREIKSPTPEEVLKDRQEIFEKIGEIRSIIKERLGQNSYDIDKDIAILISELEKLNPDIDVIGNKLNSLGHLEFIRNKYKDLTYLMNL